MSTCPLVDSAASLDPDRHFTLQDALNTYALAEQPTHLGRQVRDALDVIEQALDRYSLDQLSLSFNGGKDCTVLVHLLAAAVLIRTSKPSASSTNSNATPAAAASNGADSSASLPLILAVYVRCVSPFPQVEAFVTLCARWYHLELDAVEGGMKEALQTYLDRRRQQQHDGPSYPPASPTTARDASQRRKRASSPHQQNGTAASTATPESQPPTSSATATESEQIKAIMVGTRRTDPHGATLTPFVPTDPSWPDFMRVHPILDWSYKDVWDFLRHPDLTLGAGLGAASLDGHSSPEREEDPKRRRTSLEWCELYDYGYTSLGSTHNTFPNPLLRSTPSGTLIDGVSDGRPLGGWRPAWELEDEDAERAGRDTNLASVVKQSATSPLSSDPLSSVPAAMNGDISAASARQSIDDDSSDFPIGSEPNSRAASPVPRVWKA
ncbi:hypothetical protein JCM10908_005688 [Rhodotorula pacifica]|uniref:FMN adenylyltransferase n=1 Tax=Rhodotorula pacifica TaxID=1495444 RepID=UPI00316D97E1